MLNDSSGPAPSPASPSRRRWPPSAPPAPSFGITPYAGYMKFGNLVTGPLGTSVRNAGAAVYGAEADPRAHPRRSRSSATWRYSQPGLEIGAPIIGGLSVGQSSVLLYDAALRLRVPVGGRRCRSRRSCRAARARCGRSSRSGPPRPIRPTSPTTSAPARTWRSAPRLGLQLMVKDYIGKFDAQEATAINVDTQTDAQLGGERGAAAGVVTGASRPSGERACTAAPYARATQAQSPGPTAPASAHVWPRRRRTAGQLYHPFGSSSWIRKRDRRPAAVFAREPGRVQPQHHRPPVARRPPRSPPIHRPVRARPSRHSGSSVRRLPPAGPSAVHHAAVEHCAGTTTGNRRAPAPAARRRRRRGTTTSSSDQDASVSAIGDVRSRRCPRREQPDHAGPWPVRDTGPGRRPQSVSSRRLTPAEASVRGEAYRQRAGGGALDSEQRATRRQGRGSVRVERGERHQPAARRNARLSSRMPTEGGRSNRRGPAPPGFITVTTTSTRVSSGRWVWP